MMCLTGGVKEKRVGAKAVWNIILLTFTPICPRSSNPTLEVKLVHVFFGAVDPAVSKDNFVIH
jgi:hypothetical protein